MFLRDKSTFGALAVPGTYPCGPELISDTLAYEYDSWLFSVVTA